MPKKINNQLTKGTAWLAFGNITSRVLGAIYVVPWTIMLGALSLQANTLMGKGYNLYQFFLMLSTAGLPSAVAKFTAQLDGINRKEFLKKATFLSIIAGIVCSTLLWLLAPILSMGDKNVIPVLHSLSISVLMFPYLSILRGQLQGQLRMAEIAMSDIIEQTVRVCYMLLSTYLILYIQHGNWISVVVHSTFAAALGAFSAIVYLLLCMHRNSIISNKEATNSITINFKDVILQSLPFVIIGGFLSTYQWIDQFTFHPLMSMFNPNLPSKEIEEVFGIFNFNINKLVMIIVSLSVSIASTVLPLITQHRFHQNLLKKYISQAYLLFAAITLPACVALYTLGKPVYIVFYGNFANDKQYVPMIQISCLIALFMGLSTVLAMILQGLSKKSIALRSIFIGLIFKIVLQPFFIFTTGSIGPLLSTLVSLIVITLSMGIYVNKRFTVTQNIDTKSLNYIYIISLILLILFSLINMATEKIVPHTRIGESIFLFLIGSLGGIILLISYQKSHILEKIKDK